MLEEIFNEMIEYQFESTPGCFFARETFDNFFTNEKLVQKFTNQLYELLDVRNMIDVSGNHIYVNVICDDENIMLFNIVMYEYKFLDKSGLFQRVKHHYIIDVESNMYLQMKQLRDTI